MNNKVLLTPGGKFLKASSGKFLAKFELETEFDAGLTQSQITLTSTKTLFINNLGPDGPQFSGDFDLELVAIDPDSGYPIHCYNDYVELDWAMGQTTIYIYDIDIYSEWNWLADGVYGDPYAEGEWMVDNLTPVATLELDTGDLVWRVLQRYEY